MTAPISGPYFGVRRTRKNYAEKLSCVAPKTQEGTVMDTNTLLIILVVIFLCGGFGFYGRGRWF